MPDGGGAMAAKTQIARWGNSLAVRIPKHLADEAGLREGDDLVLEVEAQGSLAVKLAERPASLADLVSRITPQNLHREVPWGASVGAELW
jgi:antitoxin MazE